MPERSTHPVPPESGRAGAPAQGRMQPSRPPSSSRPPGPFSRLPSGKSWSPAVLGASLWMTKRRGARQRLLARARPDRARPVAPRPGRARARLAARRPARAADRDRARRAVVRDLPLAAPLGDARRAARRLARETPLLRRAPALRPALRARMLRALALVRADRRARAVRPRRLAIAGAPTGTRSRAFNAPPISPTKR